MSLQLLYTLHDDVTVLTMSAFIFKLGQVNLPVKY